MSAPDAAAAILAELASLRQSFDALRAEVRALRRQHAAPALLAAIEDYLGAGSTFTVKGLLQLADEEPHGAIAEALSMLLDMNAPRQSRATQLGARLRRMAGIEEAARAHGCVIYRLASAPEPT